MKIVSGGQTGADRAALDFALEAQILCGGWCAEDRVAEDGVIPGQYPVVPLPGADNAARTRQNVLDSDATVIFFAQMQAGTELTRQAAVEARKPLLLIDAAIESIPQACQRLEDFISAPGVRTLNIAGPRASEAPGVYDYVLQTLRLCAVWLKR
ncbi:MAG TPA: putative molybdenum carrier protein [Tepidisphaeraceae bacterium]